MHYSLGLSIHVFSALSKTEDAKSIHRFAKWRERTQNGFIKQTFFNFVSVEKIRFLSGPFTNVIFKILKRQKENMKVSDGNVNITFSTERYLFEAV